MRRRVYLNEYNIVLGRTAYLPLAMGRLRAYAETRTEVRANYAFAPFLFQVDRPATLLAAYENPAVAAFSVHMWNEQLCLAVAEAVKARWPDCLIVFGGAQVPHHPEGYFATHPFIDAAVRGEGEEAFAAVLIKALDGLDFDGIPGVSWRHPETGGCMRNADEQPFVRDLDPYPSPYLEGLFEPLMAAHGDLEFQAIIETNRGCPFLCTFCFWGKGGLSRKYRYFSLERVAGELQWCAAHRIRYVFNADSNFGMHARDMEIAGKVVQLKQATGYPEKFRTCYGKNTDARIFEIGRLFHAHRIEKGITLSRQSNNPVTLERIKRSNIKLAVYTNLQRRFNDAGIPVYCEMLLGLPGETYESWVAGVEDLLEAGLMNQVFLFHCQVYANTELADPAYRTAHGIETRKIAMDVIHAAPNRPGWVAEVEETIVATETLPIADWRRAAVFSWMVMLMHSLKAGFFIMGYLARRFGLSHTGFIRFIAEARMAPGTGALLRRERVRFAEMCERIEAGTGRGSNAPEFGDVNWELEEFSYLRIADDLDAFYAELEDVIGQYLAAEGIAFEPAELAEAVRYQRLRMPASRPRGMGEARFRFNFPEYFDRLWGSDPVSLSETPSVLTIDEEDFAGDRQRFAREVILWGRKSGLLLNAARWRPAVPGARAAVG